MGLFLEYSLESQAQTSVNNRRAQDFSGVSTFQTLVNEVMIRLSGENLMHSKPKPYIKLYSVEVSIGFKIYFKNFDIKQTSLYKFKHLERSEVKYYHF